MARKRQEEETKLGSAPDYLATYGDMVTLLFAFFVLLFAMSSVDEERFTAIASAFSNMTVRPTAGTYPEIFDLYGKGIMMMPTIAQVREANSNRRPTGEDEQRARDAQEELEIMAADFRTYFAENNIGEDQVSVEIDGIHVVLTFPSHVLFSSGRADLYPEAFELLSIVADALLGFPDNVIEIEGHTDSVPINTPQFPDNWFLSAARAIRVSQYLMYDRGFDPHQVMAIGRGEYVPVATNETAEGRALNRRVEIRVRSLEYTF